MSTGNNLEEIYSNSIKILKDLIAFKTVSGENNTQLIDYCDNILNSLGAVSFRTYDEEEKRVNLFSTIKAKKENKFGSYEIREILRKIYNDKEKFISRGDNSGTHMKELSIWKELALEPEDFPETWYLETGSGQGATLMIANEIGAFTITDTATWYSFKNKGGSEIVGYDNKDLNIYAITTVNPEKCKNIKSSAVEKIVTFLKSNNGKNTISMFRLNSANAFFPI